MPVLAAVVCAKSLGQVVLSRVVDQQRFLLELKDGARQPYSRVLPSYEETVRRWTFSVGLRGLRGSGGSYRKILQLSVVSLTQGLRSSHEGVASCDCRRIRVCRRHKPKALSKNRMVYACRIIAVVQRISNQDPCSSLSSDGPFPYRSHLGRHLNLSRR